MKPVTMTKYNFRCLAPLGFGEYGDNLTADSAIANDEDTARRIILDCYGHNYDKFLVLESKEPILLFDPKPNYVREIRTLRFAGPRDGDDNSN
jgi:hypothetical protein